MRTPTFLRPFAALVALAWLDAAPAAPPDPTIAALASALDAHPLLMMGEMHRNPQQHAYVRQLLRDPAFACRVDDVVIEFGNSRLQSTADAYIAGEQIGEARLTSMWRETQVPFAWNSPVYRELYETVRAINVERLCPHPVRLVLADAPIDWAKVRSAADLKAVPDRDVAMAEVVEREVFAKKHRALMLAGGLHAVKAVPDAAHDGPDAPTLSQLIEKRHPGAIYCVTPVPAAAVAMVLGMGEAPSFLAVHGGRLEDMDFGVVAPGWKSSLVLKDGKHVWSREPAVGWPHMGKVTDALLYYGGDNVPLYPPPSIYLEPGYQRELRRRVAIIKEVTGQDFVTVLDDLVREASTH